MYSNHRRGSESISDENTFYSGGGEKRRPQMKMKSLLQRKLHEDVCIHEESQESDARLSALHGKHSEEEEKHIRLIVSPGKQDLSSLS